MHRDVDGEVPVVADTVAGGLVGLLYHRALTAPDHVLYRFIAELGEEQSLTYAMLDHRARVLAERLQQVAAHGDRALLLFPAGLEYVVAFFGCLYAGVIAVPAYPPTRHYLQRLRAIVQDANPVVVIAPAESCERSRRSCEELWGGTARTWLAIEAASTTDTRSWQPSLGMLDHIAFLQYTSGSTGDPKGVMITHGNLLANQRAIRTAFGHDERTVVVGWLPLHHDMGLIGNVIQPLYLDATAILMAPMTFLDRPVRWLRAISKYRATTSGGPNFAYELCVRKITPEQTHDLDLSCWQLAFNGSETVRAATLRRFAAAFAHCGFAAQSFFPCYGLAESTLFVTGRHVERTPHETLSIGAASLVDCGFPAADHELRIVDPQTQLPCLPGKEGEIWLRGPSVAAGYWNRAEPSTLKFRARLALNGDASLHGYLRTGDLGYFSNGLYVTGRCDDLMVMRGRNYHPQPIEQALDSAIQELVTGGCVAFATDSNGETALTIVAEVKRDRIRNLDAHALFMTMRSALAEVFDGPIATLLLVTPGSVPRTSSGKLRRGAAKAAYLAGHLKVIARDAGADDATVSPATRASLQPATLRILEPAARNAAARAFVFEQVSCLLGMPVSSLSGTQSWQSLGLDSLKAATLKHAIDELLPNPLPLSALLGEQTLAAVAEYIAGAVHEMPDAAVEVPPVKSGAPRLSYAQRSTWIVQRMQPHSPASNLALAVCLHPPPTTAGLRRAFAVLLERHDLLRTGYGGVDGAEQRVRPLTALLDPFVAIDAVSWSDVELQADFARRCFQPFDLQSGTVCRAVWYHRSDSGVLLLCAHHIAVDLRSGLLLLRELAAIAAGSSQQWAASLALQPAHYRDFVAWQATYLLSPAAARAQKFWHGQLAGELPTLALPIDHPRPAEQRYRGSSHVLRLDRTLTEQLIRLGEQCGATLFMALLAAYSALLHRYTQQNDIVIGTAYHGRPQRRFANVVGNFVNPLALRCHCVGEESFELHLRRIRDLTRDALAHADYPFAKLVEELQPQRRDGQWPIYQTWLGLQQWNGANDAANDDDDLAALLLGEDVGSRCLGPWQVENVPLHERIENFDLRLMVTPDATGLLLSICYRTDLFAAASLARMACALQLLIEEVVARPQMPLSQLRLLTHVDYRRQIFDWNSTAAEYPREACLHHLLQQQADASPAATAVICGGSALTYAQLDAAANQLGHWLRAEGFGVEQTVGIFMERSVEMIVALLGVLKAGAAYVPIDPRYPFERIAQLSSAAHISLVLTQQHLQHALPQQIPRTCCLDRQWDDVAAHLSSTPVDAATSQNLAYVIFTSGSTGIPKGVAVTHRNAVHSLWARKLYYREPVGTFLLLSPLAFDSSVAGIFWTLACGGKLCLPLPGEEREPWAIEQLLRREQITHLLCLPSLHAALLQALPAASLASLRSVIVAGESCPATLSRSHHTLLPGVALFNEYGPTECSVWSSVHELEPDASDPVVPIGKAISNVQLYVLDASLAPVPIGVTGHLYIGGEGVARGYLGAAEQTAASFIPNPFNADGARMYRTGDLVRWTDLGTLIFLGRADGQVKVNGHRIEIGEIELQLLGHPEVADAAVLIQSEESANHLVACVVPTRLADAGKLQAALLLFLRARLPSYMVPVRWVMLERLPLTPNGKLDRRGLGEQVPPMIDAMSAAPPANVIERALHAIWCQVLNREHVGRHDNFFRLGGHSLLAIRVIGLVRQRFALELSVASLFEAPTVVELALQIIRAGGTDVSREAAPIRAGHADVGSPVPLAAAQHGLWVIEQTSARAHLYNVTVLIGFRGVWHEAALHSAFATLLQRHAALRTRIAMIDETPMQVIEPQTHYHIEPPAWLDDTDGSADEKLLTRARAQDSEPLPLSRAPLLRAAACIVQRHDGHCTSHLILTLHHIIADAWSKHVLLAEWWRLYTAHVAGIDPKLIENPGQFPDYAVWEQQSLHSGALRTQLAYWQRQLADAPAPVSLPADLQAPQLRSGKGAAHRFVLDAAATAQVNELSRAEQVTVFTTLLATLAVVLRHHQPAMRELILGTNFANRQDPQAHSMIGLLINQVALRLSCGGDPPFATFIAHVRDVVAEAHHHHQVPFAAVVDAIKPQRHAGRAPFFETKLVLDNTPRHEIPGNSTTPTLAEVPSTAAEYDAVWFFEALEERLVARIQYDAERYSDALIAHYANQFQQILRQAHSTPAIRIGELSQQLAEMDAAHRGVLQQQLRSRKQFGLRNAQRQAVRLGQQESP